VTPDDETCRLKLTLPERQVLAVLLMGDFELEERIE